MVGKNCWRFLQNASNRARLQSEKFSRSFYNTVGVVAYVRRRFHKTVVFYQDNIGFMNPAAGFRSAIRRGVKHFIRETLPRTRRVRRSQ